MSVELKFEQIKKGIQTGTVILVDVRNADELKSNGMIPGTFNIPLAELEDAFKMTDDAFQVKYGFDKASPNLCFSCQAGRRAQAAIEKLKGVLPEKNMKIYAGSFADWQAKGGEVVKK